VTLLVDILRGGIPSANRGQCEDAWTIDISDAAIPARPEPALENAPNECPRSRNPVPHFDA